MDPNGSPKPSKLILVSTKEHPALPNRAYPGSPSHNLGDMDPDSDIMVAQKNNVSRLLKGKEKEWTAVLAKERPLQLLDLPLDILKEIFKEVPNTNDLCNLAVSNSALHSVVIPIIYSRFDIFWPDTLNTNEQRTGVDALTYGLATLVMREDLFESPLISNERSCGVSCRRYSCAHCGAVNFLTRASNHGQPRNRVRRGNYFSQYVKKFSLGNGPADWVAEYLVTKESGKMLGTLVALCVARMPNLESFVWDMGTGVLRDIWIALSVLGERQPCKLEKLWVRFHDNRAALQDINPASTAPQPPHAQSSQPAPAPLQPGPLGIDIGAPSVVLMKNHREEPNFSILPALRSLTVLDIDEVAYLDELSMLLERSLDKLRELRIGFAPTLYSSYYDPKKAPLKYIVMGGVISLLMSKINDQLTVDDTNIGHCTSPKDGLTMSEDAKSAPQVHTESTRQQHSHTGSSFLATTEVSNVREHHPAFSPSEAEVTEVDYAAIDPALVQDGARHDKGSSNPAPLGYSVTDPTIADKTNEDTQGMRTCSDSTSQDSNVTMPPAAGLRPAARTLKLETLEIEMVSLNVPILIKAIDSTMLTSLTLLDCVGTEKLWDLLTKDCSPRKSLVVSIPVQTPRKRENQPRLPRMPSSDSLSKRSHYPLKLRKIHVNTVSHQLIYFLKHTLAPDSLEWMFLQDSETFVSNVSLDAIYRGPLRRHRSSLNKLMVDSAIGPKGSRLRSASSRKWMVTREVLTFLTSGKMMRLRELAMTIQYKDWHFFLQRLPQIPHLRSLYVPCLADHPYRSSLNIRDCAMTALNVVALRPEVQLCYLGIRDKCFEILETKERTKSWHNKSAGSPNSGTGETDDDEDDDVGDHHDHDDDDSDVESPILATPAAPAAPTAAADGDSEHSAVSDDGDDDDGLDSTNDMSKVKLKLREILFYDDRISIFKARHGRL